MADAHGNHDEEPEGVSAESAAGGTGATSEDGDTADLTAPDELLDAEDADVETSNAPLSPEDQALLDDAVRAMQEDGHDTDADPSGADGDAIGEMRQDMLRAQAELVNFRKRVERDREANRDAVIAEVIRALIPALDDLTRAEAHGDLAEGPMAVIGQKIRSGFDRFGLTTIGAKGEPFDPHLHEALVQLPTPGATGQTIADVVEPGYMLGDRVLRAAKVAVSVPA